MQMSIHTTETPMSERNLRYYATGSNIFGQWCGCNDKIIQGFRSQSADETCQGVDFSLNCAKLIHIGWSHNIYYHYDGYFFITGDYTLKCQCIERVKLPEELNSVHSSDITIVSDDFHIVIVDKKKQTILTANLESQHIRSFNLLTEVPWKNEAKKAKIIPTIEKCCATNNIKLFLTSEGLVYSGLPPTLVDTSQCVGLPIDIGCGNEHWILLTDSGKVYTWGQGRRMQLGHGDTSSTDSPRLVQVLDEIEIIKISAGGWHTLALTKSGDLFVWGWNDTGQLGIKKKSNEEHTSYAVPMWVGLYNTDGTREEKPILDIACGSKHSAILLSDNTIWTCGSNKYGQLGFPTATHCSVHHFTKCIANACGLMCGHWTTVATCK